MKIIRARVMALMITMILAVAAVSPSCAPLFFTVPVAATARAFPLPQ